MDAGQVWNGCLFDKEAKVPLGGFLPLSFFDQKFLLASGAVPETDPFRQF